MMRHMLTHLSLHDALPICQLLEQIEVGVRTDEPVGEVTAERTVLRRPAGRVLLIEVLVGADRSEEHTSELQSHHDLVCRAQCEKKIKLLVSILPMTKSKK